MAAQLYISKETNRNLNDNRLSMFSSLNSFQLDRLHALYKISFIHSFIHSLAPAVTVGETEGAKDSTTVLFFTSSFAYNFARKYARITIFGMWVTSRWIIDRLKYF